MTRRPIACSKNILFLLVRVPTVRHCYKISQSICFSVSSSVQRDCVETIVYIVELLTPSDNAIILVFEANSELLNSDGDVQRGALSTRRRQNFHFFDRRWISLNRYIITKI